MKYYSPQLSLVLLVVIGLILRADVTGSNVFAQKNASIAGSGTPGRLAKWTSTGTLGDSLISEDKTGVVSVPSGIRFPDGSVQTSAPVGTSLSHHQELTLLAQPSESLSFDVPRKDFPVRIDISTSVIVEQFIPCNGTQTSTITSGPFSESTTAVLDSSSGRIAAASVSLGGDVYWSAHLGANRATGRMEIFVGSCPTPDRANCCDTTPQFVISGPITYHVSMWY